MNFNQMNPMINMNEMMNNQMNNIPYNQLNQIPINNINYQDENRDRKRDIYFEDLNRLKSWEYNGFLNNLEDKKKIIKIMVPFNMNHIQIAIPIFFTKNELYSYINKCIFQKIILFYDNNILDNNDSSIEDIPDNSTIILFPRPNSFVNFKSSSLYQYIRSYFQNCRMLNIFVKLPNEKLNFAFPENISVSLSVKLIKIALNLEETNLLFWKQAKMDINDNIKIIDFFLGNTNPIISIKDLEPFRGKKITATIFFKHKDMSVSFKVFKYDTISSFYDICLKLDELKNTNIIFKGKVLKKDDKNSLASIGINSDFECSIE